MEKCEICGKDWDMKVDNHIYCAVHYVENESEECLYWDLYGIEEGNVIGRTLESSAKILEEIKRKYPEHFKRYQEERKEKLKESYGELEKLSEPELRRLADYMGVGFLNEPEDKDEIILILSTEPIEKIKGGLKKLKGADSD